MYRFIELVMKRKADTGALFRLARLWKQDKPDILYTHLYHAGIIGRIFGSWLNIKPIIVHQHGPKVERNGFSSWLDASTSLSVIQFIASCHAIFHIMQDREDISAHKIDAIYNGIIVPDLFDTAKPIEWQEPEGSTTIACLPRLDTPKGIQFLTKIILQIVENFSKVYFVIVGEGPLSVFYELLAHSIVLFDQNQASFLSFIPKSPTLLSEFDILVQPSIQEPLGNTLIEAGLAECPVVASNLDDCPEVIEHEKTGLLVNCNIPVSHIFTPGASPLPKTAVDEETRTLNPRLALNQMIWLRQLSDYVAILSYGTYLVQMRENIPSDFLASNDILRN